MQTLSFDVSGMTCGGWIEAAITGLGYQAKARPAAHGEHAWS